MSCDADLPQSIHGSTALSVSEGHRTFVKNFTQAMNYAAFTRRLRSGLRCIPRGLRLGRIEMQVVIIVIIGYKSMGNCGVMGP